MKEREIERGRDRDTERDSETERGRDKDGEGNGEGRARKQRNPASLRSMYVREPWAWLLAQGDDSPQIVTVGKFYFKRNRSLN